MVHPISDRNHREDNQSGNLNHINRDIDRRCTRDSAVGDKAYKKWKHEAKENYEKRTWKGRIENRWEKLASQITRNQRGHSHHHARVDPVIKVTGPSYDEFG